MINPQQNTVDKVIQKAVDIGLIEKTQDYLKQGYKIDNLSNGSIGIYLGNDEDVPELEYKTQKASDAQQENTPMTDNLAVALQQLSDARVSLYKAYHLGIDIDVAENELIAVREQYNAIYGI